MQLLARSMLIYPCYVYLENSYFNWSRTCVSSEKNQRFYQKFTTMCCKDSLFYKQLHHFINHPTGKTAWIQRQLGLTKWNIQEIQKHWRNTFLNRSKVGQKPSVSWFSKQSPAFRAYHPDQEITLHANCNARTTERKYSSTATPFLPTYT